MKFSVIIPVYNLEAYLCRCLDSVLRQSFQDLECICVDDGSTDLSGKILDEYAQKDSRCRVIHQVNKGVSAARNAGLRIAQGDWITFVDGDDYVSEDYFRRLYSLVTQHAGADIIATNPLVCEVTGVQHLMHKYDDGEVLYPAESIAASIEGQSFRSFRFVVWDKVFSRALIYGAGLRFLEGVPSGEDTLFVDYALAHANWVVISGRESGYSYCVREGSANFSMNLEKLYPKVKVAVARLELYEKFRTQHTRALAIADCSRLPFLCNALLVCEKHKFQEQLLANQDYVQKIAPFVSSNMGGVFSVTARLLSHGPMFWRRICYLCLAKIQSVRHPQSWQKGC